MHVHRARNDEDIVINQSLSYFRGAIPWMIEAAVILSAVDRHWPPRWSCGSGLAWGGARDSESV